MEGIVFRLKQVRTREITAEDEIVRITDVNSCTERTFRQLA